MKLYFHKLLHRLLVRPIGAVRAFGQNESWNICPDLSETSFVISGGAGYDISFELELIENFDSKVILLDPSLPGITAVRALPHLPDQLTFLESGLPARSGKTMLYEPEDQPDKRSWRISGDGKGTEYDFLSIPDILKKFGQSKIDIEGFEYEVLDQVLNDQTDIRQICVEFHQGPEYGNKTGWDRWRFIFRLLRAGYRLIHVRNRDYTFLRV